MLDKVVIANRRGVPDILACLPGGMFLALEVKRPGPSWRQTPIQECELAKLRRVNAMAYIVRDVAEVQRILDMAIPSAGGGNFEETVDTVPN